MSDVAIPRTKAELIERIDAAWNELQEGIATWTPEQLTKLHDAAGWSGKDHLAHVAMWANSILVMIRDGQSQERGVNLTREEFLADIDTSNEQIRQQTIDHSLDDVLELLRSVHAGLVAEVAALSEDDLRRTGDTFAEGGSVNATMLDYLNGDTWPHYAEHQRYIEEIVRQGR